jgi:REP element-mobilizing transposase RayT
MSNKSNDNPGIHHRRSIRLQGYEYLQNNAYFVTLCTQNREPKFGEIIDDKIVLNMGGTVAEKCWLEIPNHFPNVVLDEFITMPNHVHGIIVIQNVIGVQNLEPLQNGIIFHPIRTVCFRHNLSIIKRFLFFEANFFGMDYH